MIAMMRCDAMRRVGRRRPGKLPPLPMCRIIATIITPVAQLFVNPNQGQPLALGLPVILGQHLIQIGTPRINLGARLRGPVIAELRHPGPDHLPHRVPRPPQFPADLLDRLPLNEIRPPDLRNRLHNQHPQLAPSNPSSKLRNRNIRGALLDADYPNTGGNLACRFTLRPMLSAVCETPNPAGAPNGGIPAPKGAPGSCRLDVRDGGWGGRKPCLMFPYMGLPCQRAKLGHSWGHSGANAEEARANGATTGSVSGGAFLWWDTLGEGPQRGPLGWWFLGRGTLLSGK